MVQVDVQPYKISAADWSFGLKTKYACFNDLKKKNVGIQLPKICYYSNVKGEILRWTSFHLTLC